jgi:hypothetical protein
MRGVNQETRIGPINTSPSGGIHAGTITDNTHLGDGSGSHLHIGATNCHGPSMELISINIRQFLPPPLGYSQFLPLLELPPTVLKSY